MPAGRGVGSGPGVRVGLACAVVLQTLHGLSAVETVVHLRCDLRWTAACGLGLNDRAFDPSPLAYFRRRLARSREPDRIFDAVREVVAVTGVLRGRHRRALDSAVLEDAVATQDTVPQPTAAVGHVIREVPGRPMPWASWPWWLGRTSSPPTAPTAPTGGGASPAAPSTTGWSPLFTPMPGTCIRPEATSRTGSRPTSPSSRDRPDHRHHSAARCRSRAPRGRRRPGPAVVPVERQGGRAGEERCQTGQGEGVLFLTLAEDVDCDSAGGGCRPCRREGRREQQRRCC